MLLDTQDHRRLQRWQIDGVYIRRRRIAAALRLQIQVGLPSASDADRRLTRELIEAGVDVNSLDVEGNTLLHLIYRNHSYYQFTFNKIADMLIEKGADVNLMNKRGLTPLMAALDAGEIRPLSDAIITNLVYSGRSGIVAFRVDLENNITGDTLLHYSARIPSIDLVMQLLETGQLSPLVLNRDLMLASEYMPASYRTSKKVLYLNERHAFEVMLKSDDDEDSFDKDLHVMPKGQLIKFNMLCLAGKKVSIDKFSITPQSTSIRTTTLGSAVKKQVAALKFKFFRPANTNTTTSIRANLNLTLSRPTGITHIDMPDNNQHRTGRIVKPILVRRELTDNDVKVKIAHAIGDLTRTAAKTVAAIKYLKNDADSYYVNSLENSSLLPYDISDGMATSDHLGKQMTAGVCECRQAIEATTIVNSFMQQRRLLKSINRLKSKTSTLREDLNTARLCRHYVDLLLKLTVRLINSDMMLLTECSISLLISAVVELELDRSLIKKLMKACTSKKSSLWAH